MLHAASGKPCRILVPGRIIGIVLCAGLTANAAEKDARDSDPAATQMVLTDVEWTAVKNSIERGLDWLIHKQHPNGSFNQNLRDEPGITGLCVLAFLSSGHLPGEGPEGKKLAKTVEYLLESQQPDGLIARQRHAYHSAYSHGIGALAVAELYGMAPFADEVRHRQVIERAMEFTGKRYSQPKAHPDDEGGWRYLRRHAVSDSDLSLTSWNLMFLRSCKNTGFDVDDALITDAVAYMERLYDRQRKTFRYEIHTDSPMFNHPRGMAGAGVLSMAIAGKHHTEMAQNAAEYILRQPFDQYQRPAPGEQYPCYSAFYCSQAMFQMGGKYYREYYPQMVRTLIAAQRLDGSWSLKEGSDVEYGAAYMTALTILALSTPYQMLQVLQR